MSTVRRTDYELTDEATAFAFLDAQTHGFLGFTRPDGWPGMVAVNFVRIGRSIFFHGSPEGEKMRSLAADPRVTFLVADDFSIIPSYFTNPQMACPATQYYRAVLVRGRARILGTRDERAAALQALMEKLQPDGGHQPITADNPIYIKSLDTTAVIEVPIEEWTAKFKFGQNLPNRKRLSVAEQLLDRANPRDIETVDAMAAACPFGGVPGRSP